MANKGQMREYETIYVMRPELDDKEAKSSMLKQKELIERLGGTNIKVTAMGRKRLAWECQKENRGIFVHHRYAANPGSVKEFERNLSMDDKVLLRQSIILNSNIDPESIEVLEDSLTPVVKERKESDKRGRGMDRSRESSGSYSQKETRSEEK